MNLKNQCPVTVPSQCPALRTLEAGILPSHQASQLAQRERLSNEGGQTICLKLFTNIFFKHQPYRSKKNKLLSFKRNCIS